MVRIITDSSADFDKTERAKYGLTVFDMPVVFDDETQNTTDLNEFWKKVISGKTAHTSQPSQQEMQEEFERAKANNEKVVCVLLGSALSSTYESAMAIVKNLNYNGIYVVDTCTASVGEKILVKKACEMRDNGASAKEIFETLEKLKSKVKVFVAIDTLKFLAKSGRISKAMASLGELISLKPIFTFTEEGKIKIVAKAIGNTLATTKLIDIIKTSNPDLNYDIIPVFASDKTNCVNMMQKAKTKGVEIKEELLTPIGCTIGTHIGPGGFGVSLVLK